MKKSIFAILLCLGTFLASQTVFAADVGGKSPTKTELSVANDFAYVAPVADYQIVANDAIVSESNFISYTINPIDAPAVSMLKSDAAIPIRAQAILSNHNYKKSIKLPDNYSTHLFAVDRYWC